MSDWFKRVNFELDNTIAFSRRLVAYQEIVQRMKMCTGEECYISDLMIDRLHKLVIGMKDDFYIDPTTLTEKQSFQLEDITIDDESLIGRGIIVDRDVSKVESHHLDFTDNIHNNYTDRSSTLDLLLAMDRLKYQVHDGVKELLKNSIRKLEPHEYDVIKHKLDKIEME